MGALCAWSGKCGATALSILLLVFKKCLSPCGPPLSVHVFAENSSGVVLDGPLKLKIAGIPEFVRRPMTRWSHKRLCNVYLAEYHGVHVLAELRVASGDVCDS